MLPHNIEKASWPWLLWHHCIPCVQHKQTDDNSTHTLDKYYTVKKNQQQQRKRTGSRECNPRVVFSAPGFWTEDFVIPGCRQNYRDFAGNMRLTKNDVFWWCHAVTHTISANVCASRIYSSGVRHCTASLNMCHTVWCQVHKVSIMIELWRFIKTFWAN